MTNILLFISVVGNIALIYRVFTLYKHINRVKLPAKIVSEVVEGTQSVYLIGVDDEILDQMTVNSYSTLLRTKKEMWEKWKSKYTIRRNDSCYM